MCLRGKLCRGRWPPVLEGDVLRFLENASGNEGHRYTAGRMGCVSELRGTTVPPSSHQYAGQPLSLPRPETCKLSQTGEYTEILRKDYPHDCTWAVIGVQEGDSYLLVIIESELCRFV